MRAAGAKSSKPRGAGLRLPIVLLLIAAAALWISARLTWLDVTVFNDQSGEAARTLVGSTWQPALVPLALGALAGVAAVALIRGLAARALGVLLLLLGGASGWMVFGTIGEVDTDRVHSVVTQPGGPGRASAGSGAGAQIVPEWSRVTSTASRPGGPALAGGGTVALVTAGVFLVARPPRRLAADSRYNAPAARGSSNSEQADTAKSTGGLERDHGRELWESIDAGADPTEEP